MLVRLFDDGKPGRLLCGESVRRVLGDVGKATRCQCMEGRVCREVGCAFKRVEEPLVRSGAKTAAGFEFRRVLREGRAACGGDVHDGAGALHARQYGANKRVGRVQEMIALVGAAGVSELMHNCPWSSSYHRATARGTPSRLRARPLHPVAGRFHLDDG